jgi:hypothetical protein
MNTVKTLVLAFGLLALSTGCTKRTILAFEDQPQHDLTTLQAYRTKNYLFWVDGEHQFFLCSDKGDRLVCQRACGGNTDLACPKVVETGYTGSTNVR